MCLLYFKHISAALALLLCLCCRILNFPRVNLDNTRTFTTPKNHSILLTWLDKLVQQLLTALVLFFSWKTFFVRFGSLVVMFILQYFLPLIWFLVSTVTFYPLSWQIWLLVSLNGATVICSWFILHNWSFFVPRME